MKMSNSKIDKQTLIHITSADIKSDADITANPYAHVATRLRRARVAHGLTAAQLANILRFPVEIINAIEGGQTEDQLPCMLAMAIELDLDLQDLFGPTVQSLH